MRNEKNWSDQIYQSSLEGKVSCRNTAYANKEMIFEDQDECLMVLVITVNLMNPMPLLLKGFHGSRMGSQNLKLTEVEIKPNLKLTHNDTRVMFKFLFDFKIFCTVLPPPPTRSISTSSSLGSSALFMLCPLVFLATNK